MSFLQHWNYLEKRTKALFYSLEFTNGFRRNITSALALLYFISLGYDAALTTLMFGIARLILGLLEFPTGTFADYYSRKNSVIISFLLTGIAFLGFFSFTSFWLLAFFYTLHDIAWAFQSGISTAWVVDTLDYSGKRKELASLFSRFFFFEKTGGIIGGVIALVIVAISFRSIWLVVAILNLLMAMILFLGMKELNFIPIKDNNHFFKKVLKQAKHSLKFLFDFNNKQFKSLIIGGFLVTVFLEGIYIIAPLIFVQILGLAENDLAGLYSLLGVFVLMAPFIGEKLIHKYNYKKPLVLTALLWVVAIVVFAFSKSLILSAVMFGLFLIIDYISVMIYATAMQELIPSKTRASLGSATNFLWSIAYFVAAGLMALSIKYTTLFYSVLIAIFFGFLALLAYQFMLKND